MAKLTKNEHITVEFNSEKLKSLKLEKELTIEKKKNILLKIKISELENKINLKLIDNRIENIDKQINEAKHESSTFNNKLMDKYKIKGSFGINPDTGEILED